MMVRASGRRGEGERQIRHQLGDVRGQDIGQELPDVLEDGAALLDAGDDARKVVVQEDDVGRFPGHIRSGQPHGDADIGRPQRRRIVHAVPSDRDDVALALERRDHAQLLIGCDPRADDFRGVERELELGVRHPGEIVPGQHARRGTRDQSDLACDRHCRMRVIAGHHDHLDAGIAAPAHRLRHFGAWRILEADERRQHQVRVRLGEDILAGQQAMGEGQHSKPAIRHLGGDPGDCRTRIGGERVLSAITLDPAWLSAAALRARP